MFDTWRLLKQLDYDEYIEASIQLYLDIVNLFLYILRVRVLFCDAMIESVCIVSSMQLSGGRDVRIIVVSLRVCYTI